MNDRTIRLVLVGILIVSFFPVANAALTAESAVQSTESSVPPNQTLLVSTQGASVEFGAGIFSFNRSSDRIIWKWTDCPNKCFDVDPLGDGETLFVSKTGEKKPFQINGSDSYNWKATHLNRSTGEIYRQFSVPPETHDIDYLGDGRYIVANKILHDSAEQAWLREAKRQGWINESRETHSHLVYIYNATSDEIVWEYRFVDHFPKNAGDGYANDYTHLNDVDVVDNGSAVLLSPREFDRVVLIDKETKETRWTLGAEDEYSTLHEQHNPVLLSNSPPTVLVADSGNDRIVEYTRRNGSWKQTWIYKNELRWPRDADRLPSGNTLIVDTGNDRVIEVTPDGEIVNTTEIAQAPYDAEIAGLGDEPQGPPMYEIRGSDTNTSTEQVSSVESLQRVWLDYHFTASWILPTWVDPIAFGSMHFSILSFGGLIIMRIRHYLEK
ncbi:aryl-sulfate sulfotransferase [Haloarcula pelagica]|uniref:aryl-sulfate sulfotransferase n=1 Tax=Haloarcula pelagica TaxID=3033389 RepID=UPI0024C45AA8|nr:aryl-sulfate sulfotransferase [Halomicroarcula sp. YJ-61-S]